MALPNPRSTARRESRPGPLMASLLIRHFKNGSLSTTASIRAENFQSAAVVRSTISASAGGSKLSTPRPKA